MSEASQKSGAKKFAEGRSDVLRVNPKNLHIDPQFNVREHTEEYETHIAWLMKSIAAEGVREPIKARNKNDKLFVTNGHSRMEAIRRLEKEDVEIKTVPVILEDRYASEADITMTLITSNSGKALTTLELGKVYRRLLQLGWKEEQIAQTAGVTPQTITRALELHAAPDEIKDMVKKGEVSATLAVDVSRKVKDKSAATKVLKKSVEVAKSKGKKKATAKHVAVAEDDEDIDTNTQIIKKGKSSKSSATSNTPTAALRTVKDELHSASVEVKNKTTTIIMETEGWKALAKAIGYDD